MSSSVLIERLSQISEDTELRQTAVSDVPLDAASDGDLPPVGSVLDERYEILGLLGQGGMGHVLSARHVVLGQKLAIKVLRREMTRDAEIVERFRREARAASAIGHSGIVAVKDFGSLPSGASYYVMEHVDGTSLADVLARDGAFPVGRACDVIRQMADALGAAHAAGVVHRDVKPDNVLLTSFHGRPDHVKVLDFGIAKLDFASRLSGAHRVLGTPAYMSPEQTRGQTLDQRCDIYALGNVFYELLVGDVPFTDPRPLEVLRQQIHTVPPSVRIARPDVPDEIAALIASCLEKSPDARPESMKVVVERLMGLAPARTHSTPSVPTPVPVRVSREPLPSVSVTPVEVAHTTPSVPTSPPRRWPIALGLVLSVIGVAALAAAGGILARERVDESIPPPPTTVIVPVAIAPAVIAAPPPTVVDPVLPPPSTTSSITPPITAALPHHATHAHVTAPPTTEVASPPPSAAPHDDHPAIRVIDPWDE